MTYSTRALPDYLFDFLNKTVSSAAPTVSFEFFPPKTEEAEASLWQTIDQLTPLAPAFVSVTYGAGGSTHGKTLETVTRIQSEKHIPAAAHLTCVGATKQEINDTILDFKEAGISHIVALRGDPPAGSGAYQPHPGGYAYAVDLVDAIKEIGGFDISVAAYPETHPEAKSPEADLDNLKRKFDAGADRAITQFFFDPSCYLRFLERAEKMGITKPIIPGILPIHQFQQAVKFATQCGTHIPNWMHTLFSQTEHDAGLRSHLSAIISAYQCAVLMEAGIREFHFYTLNRSQLTQSICHFLGIRPQLS